MLNEEWRDIIGFEGYYQVSNTGKVKSLERTIIRKDSAKDGSKITKYIAGKILTPVSTKIGYQRIKLSKNGYAKYYLLHRLVATAFLPNINNAPQVHHIDEDKTHNCVENLRWVTAKENTNIGTRTQRQIQKRQKKVYCDGSIFCGTKDCAKHIGVKYETLRTWLCNIHPMPDKYKQMNLHYV